MPGQYQDLNQNYCNTRFPADALAIAGSSACSNMFEQHAYLARATESVDEKGAELRKDSTSRFFVNNAEGVSIVARLAIVGFRKQLHVSRIRGAI